MTEPGLVILMGSGETSAIGGQVFESAVQAQRGRGKHGLLRISLLETPAGFETNASRVAGRVGDFITTRLQNYPVEINLIAARKKGTPFSPDAPEIVAPLYNSDLIFAGPGSPTYAARQLNESLAWQIIQARHHLGAVLVLASAAAIAASQYALPVYEIFKAGEDPHWKPGLDFFQPYGLRLVIVSHWNNREGGAEVDTSRCFMGQERFNALLDLLPREVSVLGIDEHTALTIDPVRKDCQVSGSGEAHLLARSGEQHFGAGGRFSVDALGEFHLPDGASPAGIPDAVWRRAQEEPAAPVALEIAPPQEILDWVEARQAARQAKDWSRADQLRREIESTGWQVTDTPTGPQLTPLPHS